MESIVKDLLEELYIVEPNLKKQEKKLENIVSLMIQNIPKSEMNNEFKKELKQEILMKIHWKKNKYYTLYFPILSSLWLCGVLLFVWINLSNSLLIGGNAISFAPHIERASENAFGTNIKTTPPSAGWAMEYAPNPWMRMMAVWKIAADSMMVENPVIYTYWYTGKLTIPSGKLTVYKRNSIGFEAVDTSKFIQNLRINGLNTKALENAGIANINISEDREFGYNIGIDFTQGTVNFNQNYVKWPQSKCDTNGCETPRKLTKDDIPTDETMVSLTDEFIRKYNIDGSLYGNPVVNSEWRTDYMRQQEEGTEVYIPEVYTVTYPIKIDNKFIYEEFGGYKGMIFTIDIRNKKISNVTGLEKYNLISSEYPTIDESKIQTMIQSGGRNITTTSPNQESTKLNLSDPDLAYVRIYGEWKDGVSNDFLVPAYVFKVLDKPKDIYISDSIIVPLVDWFSQESSPSIRPAIEPIMMR